MPLSVVSENRIARWAMHQRLSICKGAGEAVWDARKPENRGRIPNEMRCHRNASRHNHNCTNQKTTKNPNDASQPFMFHYRVFGCLGAVFTMVKVAICCT